MESLPKIAIFLLFFASGALVFEIFYFRKRRQKQEGKEQVRLITKKNLIIIGVLLVLLLIPASLYVVGQPAVFEKEAKPQKAVAPQPSVSCSQVDIVQNKLVVQSVSVNDLVSFVGYCAITSDDPTQSIIRLRFEITKPKGTTETTEQLAFPDAAKNIDNKRFFKATQPNIKIQDAGTYTIKVLGYNSQLGWSASFTKTLPVASLGRSTTTPTPTPQVISQLPQTRLPDGQAGNNPPICSSLSVIPLTGPAPLTVSLTGAGEDTDGTIARFDFTFGDGAKQTSRTGSISHAYQSVGTYSASVLLRDNSGNVSAASPLCQTTITVTENPQATSSASKLRAQSDKTVTPTPTTVALPQAGISLPMIGFIAGGLLILTFGLLLAL